MVLDNLNSWIYVIKQLKSSWAEEQAHDPLEILSVVQNISQKRGRLCIPSCYRRKTEQSLLFPFEFGKKLKHLT